MVSTSGKIRLPGPGLTIGIAVAGSLCVHVALFGTLTSDAVKDALRKPDPVKVKIVERPPEPPPPPPPPPPPAEPPKPKVKPKPAKVASEKAKPQKPDQPPPEPIQGLSEKSFDQSGKAGFAAPMGNTLMTEDTGKRVDTPPPPMDVDLSADPVLVRESLQVPQHTPEALDAGFEGKVYVDVYVDETGKVVQAEVRKKIGYGMDRRLIDAATSARFVPRKNKLGKPEAAWTAILFTVTIP